MEHLLGVITSAVVVNLIILFIVKVFDNMLATSKTILIQENRGILAALNVIVSQVIFYKLINAISSSGNDAALYIVSLASGVGTYMALKINDKFSKDRVYVNILMSDNKEAMVGLREYLKDNKITNLATDGYTKDWEKTIAVTAYAQTKEESKLLDRYINGCDIKIKRVITKS